MNGWQISGTVFWHSGSTVLGVEHTLCGKWQRYRAKAADRSSPASRPASTPTAATCNIPGVTQPGTIQWLNPRRVMVSEPASTLLLEPAMDGRHSAELPVRLPRAQCLARARLLLERSLRHQVVPTYGTGETAFRRAILQCIQPSQLRTPRAPRSLAGVPGNPSTQTGFGALTYTTSPPTGLLGVGLGGDSSPRMIAFQARIEF